MARVKQQESILRIAGLHSSLERGVNGMYREFILYTRFHNYSHTKQKGKWPEELKTLDISTRLLDNAVSVRIHVAERFFKEFSAVRGLGSRRFQL